MSITAQTATTVRTAAYGAIDLLSAAGISAGAGKIATQGYLSLYSTTGPIGHVLAAKPRADKNGAKSVAALADIVLPALTEAMRQLSPADAAEFRSTVLTAIAAGTAAGGSTPAIAEMTRKITEAIDA